MTRIKICGITNIDDAHAAVDLGIDAVGFVFAPSPRQITPKQARQISKDILPFVCKVGVFVNESIDTINEIAEYCSLDMIQLHGYNTDINESLFARKIIRVFQVTDENVLGDIAKSKSKYFLLDTFDKNQAGGTGKCFNWEIARKAKEYGDIILAGGLNCENITEALNVVSPYAIDISSGVEKRPGKKDYNKMKLLINEVRNWDIQTN